MSAERSDPKGSVITDEGDEVSAVCPVIISASRSTDIPAYYAEWFVHRLSKGYIRWVNSFNPNLLYYVSFEKTRAIVFWSKNPKPLFPYLDTLDSVVSTYYFQYTLNDYENEGFEPSVPSLDDRIATFIALAQRLGKNRVIWRFDPVLLSPSLDMKTLLTRIAYIGDRISPYTEKLVFSFVDTSYAKVKRQSDNYFFRTPTSEEKEEFIKGLIYLNQRWHLVLASCADGTSYGTEIEHNSCIDAVLLRRICRDDEVLLRYLDKAGKDPGQRPACRCIRSKDIGQYDTCLHGCVYCYATRHEKAKMNALKHTAQPWNDTITGEKCGNTVTVNSDLRFFI
jgi:hypothetical protein